MTKRIAQSADRPPGTQRQVLGRFGTGPEVPLARFTQPTRLIIQRLLLEGRRAKVDADLLRRMRDERMTGVYGVTSEQSARARMEIRRLSGPASGGAVPLEAFSDPTQRVILLVAADRGGSELAPDSVAAEDLEDLLGRDMTLLSGVGGGKAVRARREIQDVLREALGRDVVVGPVPRSPETPLLWVSHRRAGRIPAIRRDTADLLRGADGPLRRTIEDLDVLVLGSEVLARDLRRAGNGAVTKATRASERSAVESLQETLDQARGSMRDFRRLLEGLARLDARAGDGLLPSEDADPLTGTVEILSETWRRLFDLNRLLWAVRAELGLQGTGWGRGDALHSAYLLTEGPQSFVDCLREVRSNLLSAAEGLHEGALRRASSSRPRIAAEEPLIGSPAFIRAVICGEDWTGLVDREGLDTEQFAAAHARRLRDLEIARRRRAGDTLADIGAAFGMSRERVRQIVRDVVASLPEDLGEEVVDAGRARRRAEEARLRARLVDEVICTPRPELAALAGRLGIEEGRAWDLLGPQARKFVRRATPREHDWQEKQWSDEAMKEALLEASLYVPALSGNAYDEVLADGLVEGPSRGSIINRFGSWNDACLAAGVTPNEKRREEYERRWSDDDLLDQVVRFIVSEAPTTSHAAYESWRLGKVAEGQDIPSTSLIRIRLGGWSAAVERAWDRLLERGWLAPYPGVQERLRTGARQGELGAARDGVD